MTTVSHSHAKTVKLLQQPFGNVIIDENGATLSIKYIFVKDGKRFKAFLLLRMRKRFNTIFYEQLEDFMLNNANFMEKRVQMLVKEKELRVLSLDIIELSRV